MLAINLIVIRSNDLEKLLDFYSLLNLKFTKEKHGDGPIHYSSEINGIVLELYPATPKFPAEKSIQLGLSVNNLEILKNDLDKRNLTFIVGKDLLILEDPDGRKIYVSKNQDNKQ